MRSPRGRPGHAHLHRVLHLHERALSSLLFFQFLPPAPEEDESAPLSLDPLMFCKDVAEDSIMLPNALVVLKSLPGAIGRSGRCGLSVGSSVRCMCHSHESDCYLADLGEAALDIGMFHVRDTHKRRYLSGCAPDLAVVLKGCSVSPFNTVFTIELQVSKGCVRSDLLALPTSPIAVSNPG